MYKIKDWDEHYENAGSRKIEHCSWCPIPNKQDGLGYALLIQGGTGSTLYAAFVATVLVCSKHSLPRNGWITDNGKETGRPLTAYDLHLKTKLPEREIKEMLERASKPDIDWIVEYSPSVDSAVVDEYKPGSNKTEQNRTEGTESTEVKIVRTANAAQHIADLYNEYCPSLPRVQRISEQRKQKLKARIREFPEDEPWVELFQRVEASDFLTGRNGEWTACGFDWLLKESNIIKVLEGNYDNRGKAATESFSALTSALEVLMPEGD